MYATIVRVNVEDADTALNQLREELVPRVKQAPGFVAGYWTRKGNSGLSMVVYESEEAANQMREQISAMAPAAVTIEDVEVREVVAHA